MRPADYIAAARAPETLAPQEFGLWRIERIAAASIRDPERRRSLLAHAGFPSYLALRRLTVGALHLAESEWEVVMDDTWRELARHLPVWLAASGRVLVTGLGLGCVVRGLLAKPDVERIDVVEIDGDILDRVGPEFARNPRVRLHLGDALRFPADGRWDYAWHDIWCEPARKPSLQSLHAELLVRFHGSVRVAQGAWTFSRELKRIWPKPLLGARRRSTA